MFKKAVKPVSVLASAVALTAGLGLSQPATASEPFIAQITMFGGNFAPRSWAFCNGQLLSISQNSALFSLLGTTYGGDGRTNFALPDMRGRSPVHPGTGPGLSTIRLGQRGGQETTRLSVANLPSHNHSATTTATLKGLDSAGDSATPGSNSLASKNRTNIYSSTAPAAAMHADSIAATTTVGNTGTGQSLDNRSPYTAVNFIIALTGIFPSRS